MKAMVFAAGLGTRLKPFTLEHPKALVDVGGIPMLQRVIIKLKNIGIREMVVNVHHFADQIVDFLAKNDNFGCDIHISDETPLLLDTGGGMLAARKWLDSPAEPIIVHNADILTDFPLHQFYEPLEHHHDALGILAVSNRKTSRYLLLDEQMQMKGWTNVETGEIKPQGMSEQGLKKLAYGGVFIVKPQIFNLLAKFAPEGTPFSIMPFFISQCQSQKLLGYEFSAKAMWHDVGKPESLSAARKAYLTNFVDCNL